MTERTRHRDVMVPFDRWEGEGRDHRNPAIVIREQPSVYRDRLGCRFEIPAGYFQQHWENEFGHRWIAWKPKNTTVQAKMTRRLRAVGVNPRYEEITRLGNQSARNYIKVRSKPEHPWQN